MGLTDHVDSEDKTGQGRTRSSAISGERSKNASPENCIAALTLESISADGGSRGDCLPQARFHKLGEWRAT